MKKFIAPDVKVINYESKLICASTGVGEDYTSGEYEADAPTRRARIFDED